MSMHNLDKAVETIDLKSVQYIKPDAGHYADIKRYLEYEGYSITLLRDYHGNLTIQLNSSNMSPTEVEKLMVLLALVKKIVKGYDKRMEETRKAEARERDARQKEFEEREAERRARVEKGREEARKLAEIHDAKTKEREERLLNEFLGDTVRVRVSGFKSKVRAEVKSREVRTFGDEEPRWVPYLKYVLDQNWHWPTDVGSVLSLEVRVGGRFETVWNDLDDSKPTEQTYRGVR